MIRRSEMAARLSAALRRSRAVALVGPRQCGKTSLARDVVHPSSPNYFDLENPLHIRRLEEPMQTLEPLRGTVVLDEMQRRPDLFPVLRVLCDRKPNPARFLILGSAAPALLRQASESLAGRMETLELSGFSLTELKSGSLDRHWLRGGFPRSYLGRSESDSFRWRQELVMTYLDRELPFFGASSSPVSMHRFWRMLAHGHGQMWNAADPARSLGLAETTIRRYLDLLTGLFLVRQLQPWHENLSKRQVKSPKIFFRDSGLLHELLDIHSRDDLLSHPRCGASWEGYGLEQVLFSWPYDQAYFWATHTGAELDLLLISGRKKVGVEFKRADAPSMTKSMHAALADLKLDKLFVVYPGTQRFSLAPRVEALPLSMAAMGHP